MEMIVKRQKAAAFLEDRRPVDPSEFRLEKLVLPQPIIKSVEIKEEDDSAQRKLSNVKPSIARLIREGPLTGEAYMSIANDVADRKEKDLKAKRLRTEEKKEKGQSITIMTHELKKVC